LINKIKERKEGLFGQFRKIPACAACGTVLISAIPSPPPIKAPITARIFLRILSKAAIHMLIRLVTTMYNVVGQCGTKTR
jgi:hypothetical protein